jgi:hypothetical protein
MSNKELTDLEVRNLVNDPHVSDEPSSSDFRFIFLQNGSFELIEATVRYPNKTNWELQVTKVSTEVVPQNIFLVQGIEQGWPTCSPQGKYPQASVT